MLICFIELNNTIKWLIAKMHHLSRHGPDAVCFEYISIIGSQWPTAPETKTSSGGPKRKILC